ncbi:tautomerase family protein [Neobacillus drentensis]|uniref:tautomerase family protein n=1 Tax=Neobacillus drentensis TaxID=220684 RepID=UPI0030028739
MLKGLKWMPYIKLKLVEGRDLETKRQLVSSVTSAVCDSLKITPDNVRIELIEIKKDLFSIGGELVEDMQNKK